MEVGDNRIELVVGIFAFERIQIIYVMSGCEGLIGSATSKCLNPCI